MNAPSDLTCQELVELVTDYLEQTLAPAERARFEKHLAGCPGCQIYLGQMRQTLKLLGTLSEESIEPAARDQLLRTFRHWKRDAEAE
jgi:anti-sigma factor RsiW